MFTKLCLIIILGDFNVDIMKTIDMQKKQKNNKTSRFDGKFWIQITSMEASQKPNFN
jgi:hypothetical protein